ncbi:translation initiation factor IF-3 [Roseibium sediminicola]|uniref:Translation initiation factor IF-3 n=1 Tax=Roseibium sediminicola TaxID=2933272 RepID=A0ABT0GSU2_9HYPH|nr:translation initiation factor IF-3 [Roseibium sp. CAU 1639]MCK7612503.1 translation initiation factor IF-3 [Roseibium sp. CAU 1639]
MDGGKFLYQLLKVVIGFIAAVLGCGLFLSWGFFRGGTPETDPVGFAATIGAGLVTASLVGATALVPATVLIGLAEAARLRSIIFHVGAAGALAFALWTLGEEVGTADLRPGSAVALAAGFVAGAIYWLIAGRSSGGWHGRARRRGAKQPDDQAD